MGLRVTGDMAPMKKFYTETIGMDASSSSTCHRFHYPQSQFSMGMELNPTAKRPYRGGHSDLYWKIGLAVSDVDASVAALGLRSGGSQFEDIGYLTHMSDPHRFTIELLQNTFEVAVPGFEDTHGRKRREQERSEFGVGGGAVGQKVPPLVGQLTLRVRDPKASVAFYEQLGMELISVQPVDKYGFTLYFLAPQHWSALSDGRFGDRKVPAPPVAKDGKPDLHAVANREWCWQLPFTTLELQHRHGGGVIQLPRDDEAGFESITVEVSDEVLASMGSEVRDPDGALLKLTSAAKPSP